MSAPRSQAKRWSSGLLGWLGYLAYPVMAGAAVAIISLGVVTWLPALAAAAHVLHRWRTDGDTACFTGVFRAFGGYWRTLWPHCLGSTILIMVLVSNVGFLGRADRQVIPLLLLQVGLLVAAAPYHVALATVAARDPHGSLSDLARGALWFAFGSARRGTALLGAVIAAPVISIPLPAGPLLLGATLPVLVGLIIADHLPELEPQYAA